MTLGREDLALGEAKQDKWMECRMCIPLVWLVRYIFWI